MQKRRRLEHDGGAEKTCSADEEHTQTGHYPVCGVQVRRSLTATVQDQKLVSQENGLGDYAAESSGPDQPNDRDDQMNQKDGEITHPGNRTKICQTSDFASNLEFARDRSCYSPVFVALLGSLIRRSSTL